MKLISGIFGIVMGVMFSPALFAAAEVPLPPETTLFAMQSVVDEEATETVEGPVEEDAEPDIVVNSRRMITALVLGGTVLLFAIVLFILRKRMRSAAEGNDDVHSR